MLEARHRVRAIMRLQAQALGLLVMSSACAGSVGFPVDNKSMIWREVPWASGGFKEYPWTLASMKV